MEVQWQQALILEEFGRGAYAKARERELKISGTRMIGNVSAEGGGEEIRTKEIIKQVLTGESKGKVDPSVGSVLRPPLSALPSQNVPTTTPAYAPTAFLPAYSNPNQFNWEDRTKSHGNKAKTWCGFFRCVFALCTFGALTFSQYTTAFSGIEPYIARRIDTEQTSIPGYGVADVITVTGDVYLRGLVISLQLGEDFSKLAHGIHAVADYMEYPDSAAFLFEAAEEGVRFSFDWDCEVVQVDALGKQLTTTQIETMKTLFPIGCDKTNYKIGYYLAIGVFVLYAIALLCYVFALLCDHKVNRPTMILTEGLALLCALGTFVPFSQTGLRLGPGGIALCLFFPIIFVLWLIERCCCKSGSSFPHQESQVNKSHDLTPIVLVGMHANSYQGAENQSTALTVSPLSNSLPF